VSVERVQDELSKLLTQSERPSIGFDILHGSGALAVILPELERAAGVTQNEYHPDDVYRHTLKVCDMAARDSLLVRWAALLHDLGKVDTRQVIHDAGAERVVFYGHETVSAEIAARVLERLRYPRVFVVQCTVLVREHMFRYERAWKAATVRRFMARAGVDNLSALFALREADCRSRDLASELELLRDLRDRVAAEIRERNTVHIADLKVDGKDVMRVLGLGPGPRVGEVLQGLLERVLDDPQFNERARLLASMVSDSGDRNLGGGGK